MGSRAVCHSALSRRSGVFLGDQSIKCWASFGGSDTGCGYLMLSMRRSLYRYFLCISAFFTVCFAGELRAGIVYGTLQMQLSSAYTTGQGSAPDTYVDTNGVVRTNRSHTPNFSSDGIASGSTDLTGPEGFNIYAGGEWFKVDLFGSVSTLSGYAGPAEALVDTRVSFVLDFPTLFHFEGNTAATFGDGGADQTISVMYLMANTGDPGGPQMLFAYGNGLFPGYGGITSQVTASQGTYETTLDAGTYTLFATTWTRSHDSEYFDQQSASFGGSMTLGEMPPAAPEPSSLLLLGATGLGALGVWRARRDRSR